MKAMSTLIQLHGMKFFSARIARMALHVNCELPQVHRLLYNLFMFGYMPKQTLTRLKGIPNLDKIKDALERGIIAIETLPFIRLRVIKFPTKLSSTYKKTERMCFVIQRSRCTITRSYGLMNYAQ